jgi:hypothetical protein
MSLSLSLQEAAVLLDEEHFELQPPNRSPDLDYIERFYYQKVVTGMESFASAASKVEQIASLTERQQEHVVRHLEVQVRRFMERRQRRREMERRPLLFVPVRRIRDAVSLRRRHPEARRFRSTRREIILDRLNRWHKRDVNTGKFVRFTQRERRVFLLSSSPLRPPHNKGGRR